MEYTDAFKAQMVRKMLPPAKKTATALAKETGVAQPTLSKWLREARSVAVVAKGDGKKKWTAAEKLRVVIEAATLTEDRLGELLRREGFHEAQLRQWRAAAEAGLTEASRKKAGRGSPEAKRVRDLERELRRKDRALAEAAALLVLKKKASVIWGDEDDDTGEGNGS
jgi:transposase